ELTERRLQGAQRGGDVLALAGELGGGGGEVAVEGGDGVVVVSERPAQGVEIVEQRGQLLRVPRQRGQRFGEPDDGVVEPLAVAVEVLSGDVEEVTEAAVPVDPVG